MLDNWKLKKAVFALLVGGLLAAVLGTVIVFAAWPDRVLVSEAYSSSFSSLLDSPAEYEDQGSKFLVFVGGVVALAGQVAAAVATIALGVRLGTRDR